MSLAALGPYHRGHRAAGGLAGRSRPGFASAPLVPLKVLKGALRVANLIVLLFSAALFPMWYVSSLYLQQVLGLSPLATGLTFLPMALVILVCASQAGKLVGTLRRADGAGQRPGADGEPGMLLFSRVGVSGSALGYVVLPGVLMAAWDRALDRALDDLRYPGCRPRSGGPGFRFGQHVAPSRWRPGPGAVDLARDQLHQQCDRAQRDRYLWRSPTGSVSPTWWVPAYLSPLPPSPLCSWPRRLLRPPGHATASCSASWSSPPFSAHSISALPGPPAPPSGPSSSRAPTTSSPHPGSTHPSWWRKSRRSRASLAPGYIMVANFYDLTTTPMVGQSGPLILNDNLQPVWFRPIPKNVVASNLASQTYNGQPVLTWWQGVVSDTGATESGEDVIVNQHYQTVGTIKGQDGWVITLHELVIRGGDAWVTANKDIPMNLSKYGGTADGVLDDSAVQEYDIATGKLLYTWDALSHIPLTASHAQPPANGFPWDAYHVNSISFSTTGDFLVSMRNTWAAYMVQAGTGEHRMGSWAARTPVSVCRQTLRSNGSTMSTWAPVQLSRCLTTIAARSPAPGRTSPRPGRRGPRN